MVSPGEQRRESSAGLCRTRSLVELIDKSVVPHLSASKALIDSGFAVEEKEMVADKTSSVLTASGK